MQENFDKLSIQSIQQYAFLNDDQILTLKTINKMNQNELQEIFFKINNNYSDGFQLGNEAYQKSINNRRDCAQGQLEMNKSLYDGIFTNEITEITG